MDTCTFNNRIQLATEIALAMLARNPSDPVLPAVLEQLKYLEETFHREGSFAAVDGAKLTLGLIAARAYDTAQPEFAELLYTIDHAIKRQIWTL